MVLPAAGLVAIVIGASILGPLLLSLGGPSAWSGQSYRALAADSYFWRVLFRTLRIALFTSAICLLLSYPAALALYLGGRTRKWIVLLLLSPLFVSGVVRTYAWILILIPQTGVIALIPGLSEGRLLYTEAAVVIVLVNTLLAFMVLSIYASIARLDRTLLHASDSLGAHRLQAIARIVWPASVPGVITGSVLVFANAASAVTIPILVGGARLQTLPSLIFQQYVVVVDYPAGSTLATVLLLLTTSVVALNLLLARRNQVAVAIQ
jgi:putative spermidine/putrescine transport system permease protein